MAGDGPGDGDAHMRGARGGVGVGGGVGMVWGAVFLLGGGGGCGWLPGNAALSLTRTTPAMLGATAGKVGIVPGSGSG